jgi:hypothetical protein
MCTKRIFLTLALVLALPALLACVSPLQAGEFETASIHLERNVTDDDAEAVMMVKAEDGGLSRLLITAPDGRRIGRFESRNKRNLGAREMLLESPEPGIGTVLAAYPEGTYHFVGKTFEGEELTGEADLSHTFAEPAHVTFPADGATVPAAGLVIQWEPVAGVSGYFLELEQEDLELVLEVSLPASATSFNPPAGWLLPGAEYVLGIGSIGQEGNRTFTESTFTLAD